MTAAVGVADFQRTALTVVAVMGRIAVRVDLFGDVALVVAPVFPGRRTTVHNADEAAVVLVGSRCIFRWNDRDQSTCFVVLVFGGGTEWIVLCDQAALVVVGLEVFRTVRIDFGNQSSLIVVGVDFFAAVGVGTRDAAFIIPGVEEPKGTPIMFLYVLRKGQLLVKPFQMDSRAFSSSSSDIEY